MFSSRTIESLCLQVTSGGTPSRGVERYWSNGTVRWFKTGELRDGWLEESEEKITEEALANSSAKIFPPHTVLMAMYGDGKTITSLGVLRNPSATNQACCAMIVDPQECEYRFLFYKLKQVRSALLKLVVAGAQRNLSSGIIKNFRVEVPSIRTQTAIADILSSYDDLIENNRRRIALLEEAARMLYREWFVHFRFPGHEHVKMSEGLPDGWRKTKIQELFTTVLGGTPARSNPNFWSGDVPWINSGEINKIRIVEASEFITEEGLLKSAAKLMRPGTTVLAITGATLGQVSYLEIECSANQSVVGVYDEEQRLNEFAYLFFKENAKKLVLLGSGGAQQHINKEIVNTFLFIKPHESLIRNFKDAVAPMFAQIRTLLFQNIKLSEARDLLLPRLMNGEIAI